MMVLLKKWELMVSLFPEHKSVLLNEAIQYLSVKEGGIYLDCTLGAGGHAQEILKRLHGTGRLIGLDRDKEALLRVSEFLSPYSDQVTLVQQNFAEVQKVLQELKITGIDGVIFDLGVSSYQLLTAERGFSYNYDSFLDMRMNQDSDGLTAYELVNKLNEKELAKIIFQYGEEKWAKRIAQFIVKYRQKKDIATTGELVEVIKAAIPAAARRKGPHPAKRTFQALRIYINDELTAISKGISEVINFLKPGGRIVVISFHSLEDRLIKRFFLEKKGSALTVLTRKPVVPSLSEKENNPRARSAKLRAAERL